MNDYQILLLIGASPEEIQDEYPSTVDLLKTLLKHGAMTGIVDKDKDISIIPELAEQTNNICSQIENALLKSKMLLKQTDEVIYNTRPMWCALAGIGSVVLWNQDWSKLKENGLYRSLVTDARGIDYMDEFIYDLIGVESGTSEHMNYYFSFTQEVDIIAGGVEETYEGEYYNKTYCRAEKAMYLLGLIIGAQLLSENTSNLTFTKDEIKDKLDALGKQYAEESISWIKQMNESGVHYFRTLTPKTDTTDIHIVCSKCGNERIIRIPSYKHNDEALLNLPEELNSVVSSMRNLGYRAHVEFFCEKCVDKSTQKQIWEHTYYDYVKFYFWPRNSSMPVISIPVWADMYYDCVNAYKGALDILNNEEPRNGGLNYIEVILVGKNRH